MCEKINLPHEIYIDFEASFVEGAQVIWLNHDLVEIVMSCHKDLAPLEIESWILENFAFNTRFGNSTKTKTFKAERYGGQAINRNGGGARVGIASGFQVKGIGPTPLAGKSSSYWYSHGGATLEESIREAIWGEICHIILPFGAARVLAIISLPSDTVEEVEGEKKVVPAAMVVRTDEVRLAHFMRSPYFEPQDAVKPALIPDINRVEAAIKVLPDIVSSIYGGNNIRSHANPDFKALLTSILAPLAEQMAVARSRKLMHGAVTCSNLCIDGKWIDFGTTTFISAYKDVIIAKHCPSFWNEEKPLYTSIVDLVYFIARFNPSIDYLSLLSFSSDFFYSKFNYFSMVHFVGLLGFPVDFIKCVPVDVVQKFFSIFINKIQFDKNKYVGIPSKKEDELIRLLICLVKGGNGIEYEFVSSYKVLEQAILDNFSEKITKKSLVKFLCHSIVNNFDVPEVFLRDVLNKRIKKLPASDVNAISDLISSCKRKAFLKKLNSNSNVVEVFSSEKFSLLFYLEKDTYSIYDKKEFRVVCKTRQLSPSVLEKFDLKINVRHFCV